MRETLNLHPGLIVLRYKKGGGRQTAVIRPSVPRDSVGDVEIISDPLRDDLVLDRPGDTVVLRCSRPARLHIDITSVEPNVPARGSVTVEYLTAKKKRQDQEYDERETYQPSRHAATLSYKGHVSYWGDISARDGSWIGGPDRPMPLEGLQLEPSRDDDTQITVTDLRSGKRSRMGEFVGTRGQSLPLRGLEFELEHWDRSLELVVRALFRDAGQIEVHGRAVKVTGAGQNDVLLGLSLKLEASVRHPPAPSTMDHAPYTALEREARPQRRERTKIFRR